MAAEPSEAGAGDAGPDAARATASPRGARRPWKVGASRRRRASGAILALAASVLAGLCALPWCDVLVGNVVPVLQALTPVWILAAAVVMVFIALIRTRAAVVAALPLLIAVGADAGLLPDHPSAPGSVRAAAGDRHLRVLSVNCEFGGADERSLLAAIDRTHPDVIVLPEMTAAKLRRLDAAGIARRYPHRAEGMIDDGARGTAVLSRFPVQTLDADRNLGPYDLQSPIVALSVPGARVVLHAVHTYPPLRDGVAQWRPQLEKLARWQRKENAPQLLMAGDFNASVAHPAFRDVSHSMVDALPATESAWLPTWPHGRTMPPFAQIDHVLTRGFVPEAGGTVTVEGTDHAGVWTQLRY